MKTLWITRAQPGAEETAARVRALGHEAIVAPLLRVRWLEGAALDLADVTALAFTSANGVRAFAARSGERGPPVFTVGERTAAAALAAGFRAVQSADGDVDALAALIIMRRPPGLVLHPGAVHLAKDLTGRLTGAGLKARAVAVYETVAQVVSEDVRARISTLDAALVHSPKAARYLSEQLARTPAPDLNILCLSPQIAESLVGVAADQILTAAFPTEEALLSLLQV